MLGHGGREMGIIPSYSRGRRNLALQLDSPTLLVEVVLLKPKGLAMVEALVQTTYLVVRSQAFLPRLINAQIIKVIAEYNLFPFSLLIFSVLPSRFSSTA